MYWYDREEPPTPKEKCFEFKGYAWVKVSGVVMAKDIGEALDLLKDGNYEDIDYEYVDDINVEEIEEE